MRWRQNSKSSGTRTAHTPTIRMVWLRSNERIQWSRSLQKCMHRSSISLGILMNASVSNSGSFGITQISLPQCRRYSYLLFIGIYSIRFPNTGSFLRASTLNDSVVSRPPRGSSGRRSPRSPSLISSNSLKSGQHLLDGLVVGRILEPPSHLHVSPSIALPVAATSWLFRKIPLCAGSTVDHQGTPRKPVFELFVNLKSKTYI